MTTVATGMPSVAPPDINEFAGWATLVLLYLCPLCLLTLMVLRRKIRHAWRWALLIVLVAVADRQVMRHQVIQDGKELMRYMDECAAINFAAPQCAKARTVT